MTAVQEEVCIVKEELWPSIRYVPHKGQKEVHDSLARHRVLAAGRRYGKSQLGGHELVPEALKAYAMREQLEEESKRREFWIVGPEYSDSEKEFRVIYNDLKKLKVPFDKPGTYNNPGTGDMIISLWDGKCLISAKSSKYPATLVGEGLAGLILGEAAKMKASVWPKYLRPALADERGWSLHTSTPEGKNWFYDNWKRGQDPNSPSWASWRRPSWMNRFIFPLGRKDPEIADMATDMSEEKFNQEIGASFTEYVGRVFKDFDEEIHVQDLMYNPKLPLYGACDYGWTNPFVWLVIQVDVWDNVYVLGEYRVERKDINDIGRDLSRIPGVTNAKMFYPDPASPGDTAILHKLLRIPPNNATGGELKYRLEYIRQGLKLVPEHAPYDKREPKLLIDRSCRGLISEMQDYRYPDTKSESKPNPEEPLDKDNHGPEALGRFYRGFYGPPQKDGRNRTRQSRAKVSRAA